VARWATTLRPTASVSAAEVLAADDLAELALGFEHPGGRPAQAHAPFCQRLTVRLVVRLVVRQMPIVDSIGFVELNAFQSADGRPSAAA
jgi:hypothetical protein